MDFNTLVETYEDLLLDLHYRYTHAIERNWGEEEIVKIKSQFHGAQLLFQRLKYENNEIVYEKYERVNDNKEDNPVYMLLYRGLSIPVYVDDAGQQEFAIFNGESFGAGAYNFDSENTITDWIDDQIDNSLFKYGKRIHE